MEKHLLRRFTPGGHQYVQDNVTGLIWSTETLKAMNWYKAMKAGKSYRHCGFNSGWRLPTVKEMVSIVDYGNYSPAIDSGFFPDTQAGWYWSSDVYAPNSGDAWYVNFNVGYVNYDGKSNGYYVRLVRGGQ